MALLNRFFPSRKKAQRNQRGYVPFSSKELKWEPFDFSENQVRVLLFRECEKRGRKLLFDSKSVKKVPLQSNQPCTRTKSGSIPKASEKKPLDPPFVEVSNGFGYQYFTKSGSDIKLLGEMVFGSVAMTVRGSTLKVHVGGPTTEDKLDSLPTVMITKVALSPLRGKRNHLSESFTEDSCGSSINSMSELISSGGSSSDSKLYNNNLSHSVDVPQLSRTQFFLGTDTDLMTKRLYDDGVCYGDTSRNCFSNTPSFPVSFTLEHERKASGGSLSSVRRRWLRSTASSLECQSSSNQLDSLTSCGSLNGSIVEGSGKRSKLGTAILLNLSSEQSRAQLEFVLEHAALLETILLRLHNSMELAYLQKDLFVSMMMKAAADVQQSVCDLLCGPRLAAPVWLSLMSVASHDHSALLIARSSIASSFMYDLCYLLDIYDIKDTNFFISTLITAVLTHHLGWVSTVINSSHASSKTGHALSEISKCHPYNPLWAQMMDLCGAVGTPLKTSRTIVVAETPKSRVETVERLLRVLSYFIRCAGLEKFESCTEGDCRTLEKSQGSDVTLIASETASRDPSMVSFCEVTIQKPANDRCKNDENLMYRVDSSKIIIDDLTLHVPKESPPRSAKDKKNGMRRAMSFSAKLSKEDELERGVEAADTLTRVRSVEAEPVKEKSEVIFVLGENEDLVGLKSKDREDKRTAQQSEQALSEVESGFSECDSLELSPLSPVRNSRPIKTKNQFKCWCATSRFSAEVARTCLLDVTNDLAVFKKSGSVYCSLQLERETKRKNGFLARSLSVNLPVCQRLVKQVPQTCYKCEGSSGAENLKRTSSKKEVCRKLHKASSLLSFNAKGGSSAKANRENGLSLSGKSRSSDEVRPEERREQSCWDAGDAEVSSDVRRIPLIRLSDEEAHVPQWTSGVASALFGGVTDHYVSDRALQGIVTPSSDWPLIVKRDLSMDAANPILDPEISEAVAIIGFLETCHVDLLSSNAPHRGELSPQGARVTISRLVANMLESLRHLWLIGASPELCVNVLEERLAQLCTRSYALVDLLLSTELCDIETVTSTLSIDANDVPLLLAVASTYSPEVTRRYGVSFR